MEWVKQLIEKHTDAEGKLDGDALLAAITAEAPKYTVPKAEFNAKNDALKTAQADLKALQESTGDVEALKKQITDANDKAVKAEGDYTALVKSAAVKDALTAAGGTDLDYLAYKLGDVDDVSKIDNRIKDLQKDFPAYFPKPDEGGEKKTEEPKPGAGFKTIDNGLKGGEKLTEEQTMNTTLDAAFGFTS